MRTLIFWAALSCSAFAFAQAEPDDDLYSSKKPAPVEIPKDVLARSSAPPADNTQLVLKDFFPDLGLIQAEVIHMDGSTAEFVPVMRRAFQIAPAGAYRFMRVDDVKLGLKKGEPVLLLQMPRAMYESSAVVSNIAGRVCRVPLEVLTSEFPKKTAISSTLPPMVATDRFPDPRMAPAELQTALNDELLNLTADRNVVFACADKYVQSRDKTRTGASNYAVVTKQGGRVIGVENLGDKLEREGWSKCNGPAIDKRELAVAAKINAAWAKDAAAHIAAVREHLAAISSAK